MGISAAITSEQSGRYQIQDPTFGPNHNFWLSKDALESQTDGYFLVPAGNLPAGWTHVARNEGQAVWGRGNACCRNGGLTNTDPSSGGGVPSVPRMPGGPEGPGDPCKGMAQVQVWKMNCTPRILDNPLGYQSPAGPGMTMVLNYNYNEGAQPSTFTFTNVGVDWSVNWVSYLTVDSSNNVTVRVCGGGYETYNYPYAGVPNVTSQAEMVDLGSGAYQRQLPDGSIENFTLFDGTNTYLTSVVDPQGNAATISYDGNYRLTGISDACGNPQTTFSYVSNTSGSARLL